MDLLNNNKAILSVIRGKLYISVLFQLSNRRWSIIYMCFNWLSGLPFCLLIILLPESSSQTLTRNYAILGKGIIIYFVAGSLNIAAFIKLRQKGGQEFQHSSSTSRLTRRRQKSALGILLMGFSYFLLKIPIIIYYIVERKFWPIQGADLVHLFYIGRLLPSCHCFVNVATMCWVSKKYRNAYRELLMKFKLRKRNTANASTEPYNSKSNCIYPVIEDAF